MIDLARRGEFKARDRHARRGFRVRSWAAELIASRFLTANFLYQPRLEQGPQKIHGALTRDGESVPKFSWGEAAVIPQELEQLFLSGAQHQFLPRLHVV